MFFLVKYLIAEHMLFYASEKYPLEDDYSKYISEVLCTLFCFAKHILFHANSSFTHMFICFFRCFKLHAMYV